MAALPSVQALKVWGKVNPEEQAIVLVEGGSSEQETLQEGCVGSGAEVDESARRSLVSEENEQASGVLLITDKSPSKKSLFKNDCGLLKLLPSKRKFAWEDVNVALACQKPEQRRRFSVQAGDESSDKDGRRFGCSEQINPNGRAVVGSFMKWMLDVGKGLTKKRRFPTPLSGNTQHSTNPCYLESPVSNLMLVAADIHNVQEHQMQQENDDETCKSIRSSSPHEAKLEIVTIEDHDEKTQAKSSTSGARDRSGGQGQEKALELIEETMELERVIEQESEVFGGWQDTSPEFIATMATVKRWVDCNKSFRKQSPSVASCRYCGLKGHIVSDCSETLECEVKELERREALLEEVTCSSEAEGYPCLRCLTVGHLGALCRLSVTEAAVRARQNSQFRKLEIKQKRQSNGKAPGSFFLFQRERDAALSLTTNNRLKPRDEPKKSKVKPREVLESTKGRKSQRSGTPPQVPKGFFAAVESARLSRSELWSLESSSSSSDFSTQARGFFLRLRFGKWEKAMGGTGYRMARVRGTIRNAGDDKSFSVSVDLGDMDCTVDSQYVSNQCFTEAELAEWWKGRWRSGRRLISQAELQTKLAHMKIIRNKPQMKR